MRGGVIAPAVQVFGEVPDYARAFAFEDEQRKEHEARVAGLERRFGLPDRGAVAKAGEIYLELEAVDLEDEAAILTFANRFGVLGISSEGYSALRDLPWYAETLPTLRASAPPISSFVNPQFGGTRPVAAAESRAQFQFGARVLRDLRAAYICLHDDTPEGMIWQSTTRPPTFEARGGLEFAPGVREVSPAKDPARALARFLETTLTAGLRVFHPRVTLTAPEGRPEHGWMSGATVSLYATCCLELYNHLAEEATYRRCENRRCRRLFVRQKGRAQAGQHRRTGIKYCSSHCARAVAQRKYRERRRRKTSDGRATTPEMDA
jgi:hypothetical protein